ncbi:MAG: AzlD domain-containing protein [Solirubrobacteraceae bacterium]
MSTSWALVLGCAVLTFAIKAAGPVALGGRTLPAWFGSIVGLLAPALLAALVATHTLTSGHRLTVGPVTAGVLASALVMWRTRSIPACVLTAAVVTALLRAL